MRSNGVEAFEGVGCCFLWVPPTTIRAWWTERSGTGQLGFGVGAGTGKIETFETGTPSIILWDLVVKNMVYDV